MGPWRSFKSWVKRTVMRLVLRVARTKFVRIIRKIVRASPVPLAVTGGGAAVGAGVASAVAFPLGFGALIGAGVGVAGLVATKLYLGMAAERGTRQRPRVNYTVWRKEKSSDGRSYVVEASTSRRF